MIMMIKLYEKLRIFFFRQNFAGGIIF